MKKISNKIGIFQGNKILQSKKCTTSDKIVSNIKSDTNFSKKGLTLEFNNLINKFQRYGHLTGYNGKLCSQLEDSNRAMNFNQSELFMNLSQMESNKDVTNTLKDLYCGEIRLEFEHLNDEERIWFNDAFLKRKELYEISIEDKIRSSKLMNRAEYFDKFLATKFQSVKRYSGEGAESALVCVWETLNKSAANGISNVVMSMAHRCRNNLLTVLLNYPPVLYFRKMKGKSEFSSDIEFATGDTFSHYHTSCNLSFNGGDIQVSLIPNPSHLESNTPVGAGKVRSKMWKKGEGDYSKETQNFIKTLGLFIHGDASVCGQGIIPETLVMTNSPRFQIGGSIHIVINNGVGFTTETPAGLNHVTDVGKIINSPVIHVNAFNIDEVIRTANLALDYRNKFHKDVFINLICYRKWGHNELDDPTITQPLMYSRINSLKSIPETYIELLKSEDASLNEEINRDLNEWKNELTKDLEAAFSFEPPLMTFKDQWKNMKIVDKNVASLGVYDTGFDKDLLREIGKYSVGIPEGFNVHNNVYKSHIQKRIEKMDSNKDDDCNIDWATAEAFAIGSLLVEGHNCRLSGQDVGRGTFNHRHFCLTDQKSSKSSVLFNECDWSKHFKSHGYMDVANSILSEEAVLGFEFGMALDNPDNLIIWEAQFGDFFNGAQIIFDTYLGSSETKWLLQNGLVVLLPHGYDGAGPEHSSCRIERFLQLTDSKECKPDTELTNMSIVNPTTPAQYFHVLRRQIHRPFRKPLIVIAPKLILRSPHAVSNLLDFHVGKSFQHILPHNTIYKDDDVKRVLVCSGKHFYTLNEYLNNLDEPERKKFALVRIEQLTPFPIVELMNEFSRYKSAKTFVWCQEEARNMGAWNFVESRCRNMLNLQLQYCGRDELATPAVGIAELHKQENVRIVKEAFLGDF